MDTTQENTVRILEMQGYKEYGENDEGQILMFFRRPRGKVIKIVIYPDGRWDNILGGDLKTVGTTSTSNA